MNPRLMTGIVMIIGAAACCAAGDNNGEQPVQKEKTSSGVVLEYDREPAGGGNAVKAVEGGKDPSNEAQPVELIVGGQAEDGVAKRKDLPVRK